jgi:5-methylcytosine-specific restriction endonuclease McrA
MQDKVRARVMQRCHSVCERCGVRRAVLIHHRQRRSQGGGDDEDNLMALCSQCHSGIHDHPADSYRDGYMIRSVQNVQKGLGYDRRDQGGPADGE